jgi:imidazolonepropionase-like amidohydrolase
VRFARFCVLLAAACACSPPAPRPSPPPPAPAPEASFSDEDWGSIVEEAKVEALLQRASREHRPEDIVFDHVTVVSMTHPGAEADQRVVVSGGVVRALGPAATTPIPSGARVVDARGRWLLPGLVDMHVHTMQSSSAYLLDLANGITSVREMNGFRWLLAMRADARAGRLLVPNLYVAGHILNGESLGWYATVVETPEQARSVVARQSYAGYDFIKVHNVLRPEVFDAICQEARARGMDVVGHVPHDITVARAVACPMRTLEHFKGYILDAGLTLSTEDYVAATRGADVWNTPTFYNWRDSARGEEARRLLALPEMRYVPARRRAEWSTLAGGKPDAAQQNVRPLEEKVFRDLAPIQPRFLAGTDSGGGYPYHVPGFSLHEELETIERLGLSPYETLRTATVEPARAMRREGELGTIEVGRRADLVLLSADPLKTVAHTEEEYVDGVVVRGIWLSRAELASLLDAIAGIYAGPAGRSVSRAEVDAAVRTFAKLRAERWTLRTHLLRKLRTRLNAAGLRIDDALFRGVEADSPPDGD